MQGPQPDEPAVATPDILEGPPPPPQPGPDWRSLPPSEKIRLGLAKLKPLKQRRFPDWYTPRD